MSTGGNGHDISRRWLRSAAGVAAAAARFPGKAAGTAPAGPRAAGYGPRASAWRGRVAGRPDVLAGPGYLYRPGHVLVEDDQAFTATVLGHLRRAGATPHEELTLNFAKAGLPVRAFQVPDELPVPDLVGRLRRHGPGEPAPNVGPNYVFTSEYEYEGGFTSEYEGGRWGDPGLALPEGGLAQLGSSLPQAPGIAILDTGYDPAVAHLHPALAERLVHAPGDGQCPLAASGYPGAQAGHGTFVAGIIMRVAPGLRIRQVRVLDPGGVGDDATVALGLARAAAPVISLSLGGYTRGDQAPVALAAALAQLDESVAVVAAAGNSGSDEPFWPAAFPRVIAVGALDATSGAPRRADFSNHGNWVAVYAPGVDVPGTYRDGIYQEADGSLADLPGCGRWSGTSFAAPQVAAEIAARVTDGVTARQAATELLESATWLGDAGKIVIPAAALAS